MKKCAIYTLYKPDSNLIKRIHAVYDFFDLIIFVDNTPGGYDFKFLPEKIKLYSDGFNKGLPNALNIGLQIAYENNMDYVYLFDQDSSPDNLVVKKLLESIIGYPYQNIIVGPLHIDDANIPSELDSNSSEYEYFNSKCLATSGIAFKLTSTILKFKFDESLFLDLVDFDWCWRLELNGFKVFKILNIKMPHRLGICQRNFCGIIYHIPAPFRHYFQFRDSLRMAMRPYVPIKSKIRLLGILPIKLIFYPIIMDDGFKRFKWMIKGIYSFAIKKYNIGLAYSFLSR
jgi:rhamnosyltransferase